MPQVPTSLPDRGIGRCRSNAIQIGQVVWYPLLLMILYLLLSLWPRPPSRIIEPTEEYLSYIGKSALSTSIPLPRLQYQFAHNEGLDFDRREKVKASIKETWDLYVQQAWGWDEVRPVTGGGRDSRYFFLLPRFELRTQKWVGCNDCGWFRYAPYRWPRRGVPCCVELYDFYQFPCCGRPC
jgi:hypothetical protein